MVFPILAWWVSHVVVQYLIVREQPGVAPDTVFLNHLLSLLPDHDYLGFLTQGKDCGMPHAILGLKPVFNGHILVRHMAIITAGMFSVGAVAPCGILGSHDVAVHTGGGFIREVGGGPGNMDQVE